MEFTYENVLKWFDVYLEDVNKNQGPLETVPNLKKYFTPDFEFLMYTEPSLFKIPLPREQFLMLFVHPGLHEALIPKYYVVDVKQMIVVVQFEICFSDQISGKTWPPIQASCHYHFVLDENKDLKIKKIHYWTEATPQDIQDIQDLWFKRRDEELAKYAISYINAKP